MLNIKDKHICIINSDDCFLNQSQHSFANGFKTAQNTKNLRKCWILATSTHLSTFYLIFLLLLIITIPDWYSTLHSPVKF